MDDRTKKTATLPRPGVGTHIATEGEFAGWKNFYDSGFETHNGPFWYREEADGTMRSAFRIEKKHLRDAGIVHGGCLMTFADISLHVIAWPMLQGFGVTTNLSCEFIDAAREGELIECTGEVTRAGGSLIFVRGKFTVGERPVFTFSGTIKRLKPKGATKASAS